jgi:hypothetical protein
MQESKFLGALLPTSPDFAPIIEAVRVKYKLPEVDPDGEPIEEIYLGDEIVPLEEFRKDLENFVRKDLAFMPPEAIKQYKSAQALFQMQEIKGIEFLPNEFKEGMKAFVILGKNIAEPIIQIWDLQIDAVVKMLYVYLLTGETEEAPSDWFGKVTTMTVSGGEPVIMAIANEITNLDLFVQQIREAHKKAFGTNRPKLTDTIVSTGYYMQLKRLGKKWDFIVEEFIKRNKFSLPRDKNSKRYFETRRKYERALRKRIDRSEKILSIYIK